LEWQLAFPSEKASAFVVQVIPIETVNEVWERVNEATEEQAQAMARRAQEQQPYIMVYLLAMDENIMTGEEQGLLLQLGAYVMEIIYAVRSQLRQVTDVDLENAEEANLELLEQLEQGSEMDFEGAVGKMVGTYNQMPLLGALLEALMSGHEESPELAPENLGLALMYLKTVIDCLDQ
jgi:hypothetical protein